jgi:rfaE bifunctional protein nucleotidyltransferase chain/domain
VVELLDMTHRRIRYPLKQESGKKRTIVYTYGVFDLFHRGHVQLLADAKALGDELVVGVFTDEVSESFKRKPVIHFEDRKHMVEHCVFVDHVVVQDELQPDKNLRALKPDVLAKGPGAGWEEGKAEVPGESTMRELGGRVARLNYHDGISTSDIIKKVKEKH